MTEPVEKIRREELVDIAQYERIREDLRRQIIELKKSRRVSVGDRLSLLFENRDTVRFQIQEMMRTERIVDEGKIQDELEVYNQLIPGPGELSATLFVEVQEPEQIRAELDRLIGVDEHVILEVAGEAVRAWFEPGRSREDRLAAVQYVRFRLTPGQVQAFRQGASAVRLLVDHPRYRHEVELPESVRASLARDLA